MKAIHRKCFFFKNEEAEHCRYLLLLAPRFAPLTKLFALEAIHHNNVSIRVWYQLSTERFGRWEVPPYSAETARVLSMDGWMDGRG